MSDAGAGPEREPVLPLLDREQVSEPLQRAFDAEIRRDGRVRNLTRIVAASPASWGASTRALHLYLTLKRLDPATVSLLCLHTSMLNGCRYCIDDAAGAALEEGLAPADLLDLADLPPKRCDERMTAALRLTACLTLASAGIPTEVTAAAKRHFDDEELLELTTVVSMKCFWNRFASGLGIPPEGRCRDQELFAALCEAGEELRHSLTVAEE